MSASFVLALDTAAPVVTWGSPSGTTAGELFQVGYAVDEPGIDSAVLRLSNSVDLPLEVLADRLEVMLPPDAPAGVAHVRAQVLDDVGNAALRSIAVALTGTIVEPTGERPTPGWPGRPRPRGRTVRARSSLRARSRSTILVAARRPAVVQVSTRQAIRVRASASASATASSRARLFTAADDHSRVRATSAVRIVRVWDDDDDAMAVLLLG